MRDPRARLDAIFWMAAHTRPWRAPPPWHALSERFGKPDTVSRQFRRWAKQGLWTRLLEALADDDRPGAARQGERASEDADDDGPPQGHGGPR